MIRLISERDILRLLHQVRSFVPGVFKIGKVLKYTEKYGIIIMMCIYIQFKFNESFLKVLFE